MFPIAALVIGVFVLIRIAAPSSPPSPSPVKISGSGEQFGSSSAALAELARLMKSRRRIPPQLVQQCMAECYESGDVVLLARLRRTFGAPIPSQMESKPLPVETKSPEVVVGKNSPIYGVSNDEWDEFVGKLKQHEPSYKDERHIGAFHHSRKRLGDLGIDPDTLGDETSQYGALESDLKDVLVRHKKLINEFSGDSVSINGQTLPITRSGILGLIKTAGIDGATSWLKHEEDRLRYPYTTQAFLNTNGLF